MSLFLSIFSCYQHLKFYAQLSWARKKVYNPGFAQLEKNLNLKGFLEKPLKIKYA